MELNGIYIRIATSDDLSRLTDVHARAFAGTLGASLGDRYLSAFLGYFLRAPSALCVVAEAKAGVLAGYVFGAPDGYSHELDRRMLPNVVLSILTHPRAVLHANFLRHMPARARSLLKRPIAGTDALPVPRAPTFDLVGIGTNPDFRGRGVGARVLHEFVERAFERDFASVVLDVHAHNAAARRMYESSGWSVLWDLGPTLRYRIDRVDRQSPKT